MVDTRLLKAQQRVDYWQTAQDQYKTLLHQFSQTVHPFSVTDNAPQTSSIVTEHLHVTVGKLQTLAQTYKLSQANRHLRTVSNQLSDLASLMDVWWFWVEHSLVEYNLDFSVQHWLTEILLPKVYWERQLSLCRSNELRLTYLHALEHAQHRFHQHPLSSQFDSPSLAYWHTWANTMSSRFQRTSSAVEGRNGYLSQINLSSRGLSSRRLHALTVLHNFELRRPDGSTPAQRFFHRPFPDLFESLLPRIPHLPLPRIRHSSLPLSPLDPLSVPP